MLQGKPKIDFGKFAAESFKRYSKRIVLLVAAIDESIAGNFKREGKRI